MFGIAAPAVACVAMVRKVAPDSGQDRVRPYRSFAELRYIYFDAIFEKPMKEHLCFALIDALKDEQ
jgi:hypothetical protein